MELRALRYFLAVAREENMTEAANVLHVTQPTLSRQIAELEAEFGKKLFTRTNRNTVLTEDGMHLRQRAEEILSLVDQTESEMNNYEQEYTGNIRIGAAETQNVKFLTDTFALLHMEHPGITIELFSGNADAVQDRLEHGLIDFALLLEPVSLEKFDFIRLPNPDRLGIVTDVNSPWGHLTEVHPEDLRDMPLLRTSRASSKSYDLSKWSNGTLTPEDIHVVGRFDLIGNASHLVRTRTCNAITIDSLWQLQDPSFKFLPFEPKIEMASVVAWKKYHMFSKTSQLFLDHLQENLKLLS